jgi:hypothetical protein
VTLAHEQGTPDMARGELMRYLAETTWYPTALLPGKNVHWEAVDDRSASATLTDADTSVTLLFTFNQSGEIEAVSTEARGRMVKGQIIPTPWEGRSWNYQPVNGMRVPFDGEVAWLLPEGRKPYWRGIIKHIAFEFAY